MPSLIQRQGEIATPRTRSALDALVAQREELRDQLRSAEDRRASLAVQSGITPAEQRGAVQQRIAALDDRIQRLESQLTRLDQAIASGSASSEIASEGGGGRAVAAPAPPLPPLPPVPDLPGLVLVPPEAPQMIHSRTIVGGALVTLSLMALVAWVTWKRAKARFGRGGVPSVASPDVTRLQQSVDAMALEVERISESQRFLTKVLGERAADRVGGGQQEV